MYFDMALVGRDLALAISDGDAVYFEREVTIRMGFGMCICVPRQSITTQAYNHQLNKELDMHFDDLLSTNHDLVVYYNIDRCNTHTISLISIWI